MLPGTGSLEGLPGSDIRGSGTVLLDLPMHGSHIMVEGRHERTHVWKPTNAHPMCVKNPCLHYARACNPNS